MEKVKLEKKLEKFFSKIVTTKSGCWEWIGCTSKGYGLFRGFDSEKTSSHRFSYLIFNGELKNKMHIDHLCKNTKCCNPRHLEQVTPKENVIRAKTQITHCPYGHQYSQKNTRLYKNARNCKECNKLRSRKTRGFKNGYRNFCEKCKKYSKTEPCWRCKNETKKIRYSRNYT